MSHIWRTGLADHLCMHKPYTLQMVHLSLQAVHWDHFRQFSSERRFDDPVVVSRSHRHVRYQSGACWPTLVSEVHCGHKIIGGPLDLWDLHLR